MPPAWLDLRAVGDPVLLVCTNGRRDVCCATLGRDVASHAAQAFPDRIWEASHLSGHRLAATTVLLPSGDLHGRVLDATTIVTAADRGELLATGWRGRSTWERAGQVAEFAIREREGIWDAGALTVQSSGDQWLVTATHRSWVVSVVERLIGEAPPSCGKPAQPTYDFDVTIR